MSPLTAIARLRDLYVTLLRPVYTFGPGYVAALSEETREAFRDVIEALEKVHTPAVDPETARLHAAVQDAGVDGGLATSEAIEALDTHLRGTRALVEVKPLIWRIVSGGDDNPLPDSWPVYHGSFMERVQSIVVQSAPNRYTVASPHSDHPTLAAAQEAAQREWESFIRAAVEETPSQPSSTS